MFRNQKRLNTSYKIFTFSVPAGSAVCTWQIWTLPPLYTSELSLFSDSGVLHVHFVVESFTLLFLSSWFPLLVPDASFQHPLFFSASSLKRKLGVWKVWSCHSGSVEHPFPTHSKTSHLVFGSSDSEPPELADTWLLPEPSCLWLGSLFSKLKVWSQSASSEPPLFFSSVLIRESSSSTASSDLKQNQEENIGLSKY